MPAATSDLGWLLCVGIVARRAASRFWRRCVSLVYRVGPCLWSAAASTTWKVLQLFYQGPIPLLGLEKSLGSLRHQTRRSSTDCCRNNHGFRWGPASWQSATAIFLFNRGPRAACRGTKEETGATLSGFGGGKIPLSSLPLPISTPCDKEKKLHNSQRTPPTPSTIQWSMTYKTCRVSVPYILAARLPCRCCGCNA
jgi:hypothetical protein